MTAPLPRRSAEQRRLFGELLLEAGLVSPDGLRAGLEAQKLSGGRLGCHLVRLGSVLPASLHAYLGECLETLRPDLVRDVEEGAAASALPARLAHHYGVLPVRAADGVLDLAVSSVDALALGPALGLLTGLAVEPIICPPAFIAKSLERFYPGEVEPGVIFRSAGDHLLLLADADRGLDVVPPERLPAGAPASAWLRAILADAIRRQARRVEIVPRGETTDILLVGRGERTLGHSTPRGPYAGIAALIDGLARIAARGRILPRDGRFTLLLRGGRRVVVSVLALPGLLGHSYLLDLRDEAVASRPVADADGAPSGLAPALDRMASERRGLILLAGVDPTEQAAGLDLVLGLLGDRLPHRAVPKHFWDSRWSGASCQEDPKDLVATRFPAGAHDRASLYAAARERLVLAAIDAVDPAEAAAELARPGGATGPFPEPAGILTVRLLEALCPTCRLGFEFGEVLSAVGLSEMSRGDSFWTSPGCAACRGSGSVRLETVGQFLPLVEPRAPRPSLRARTPSEAPPLNGRRGLFREAVRAAAEARIDVKEVLRLLHERR